MTTFVIQRGMKGIGSPRHWKNEENRDLCSQAGESCHIETEMGPQDGIWKPNELQLFKLVRLVVQLMWKHRHSPTDPKILAIHGLIRCEGDLCSSFLKIDLGSSGWYTCPLWPSLEA